MQLIGPYLSASCVIPGIGNGLGVYSEWERERAAEANTKLGLFIALK